MLLFSVFIYEGLSEIIINAKGGEKNMLSNVRSVKAGKCLLSVLLVLSVVFLSFQVIAFANDDGAKYTLINKCYTTIDHGVLSTEVYGEVACISSVNSITITL